MKKLPRVKVAFRESERWFGAIFNQTFGFIQLMEPIEILMKGNQTALNFAGISNTKVIHSPLWLACCLTFDKICKLSVQTSPLFGFSFLPNFCREAFLGVKFW